MNKEELAEKNLEKLADFVFSSIPKVIEAWDKLEPKDKVEMWIKIAQFAFPQNGIIGQLEPFGFDEN